MPLVRPPDYAREVDITDFKIVHHGKTYNLVEEPIRQYHKPTQGEMLCCNCMFGLAIILVLILLVRLITTAGKGH